jgi:hypothetical protein
MSGWEQRIWMPRRWKNWPRYRRGAMRLHPDRGAPYVEDRHHWSGDDLIRVCQSDDQPDMYVSRDTTPADSADLDFIANARHDVPRLIAEVRRLRNALEQRADNRRLLR